MIGPTVAIYFMGVFVVSGIFYKSLTVSERNNAHAQGQVLTLAILWPVSLLYIAAAALIEYTEGPGS